MVFAFKKFRSYLFGTKVIMHTDHLTLQYLMVKNNAKSRSTHWVPFLQEFDFKVIGRKGIENQVVDHLSKLKDEAMEKFNEGWRLMIRLLIIEYDSIT